MKIQLVKELIELNLNLPGTHMAVGKVSVPVRGLPGCLGGTYRSRYLVMLFKAATS